MVRVSGSLVVDTSPQLRAFLLQAIERRVGPAIVIDLSRVSYLDTSGIATLLDAARVARAHAVRLRVIGVAGEPKMLAQVTEDRPDESARPLRRSLEQQQARSSRSTTRRSACASQIPAQPTQLDGSHSTTPRGRRAPWETTSA